MIPVWAQLAYLLAAVCFIIALKGLSSPRTARRGNLIGAAGAILACVTVVTSSNLDHLLAILVAVAIGAADRKNQQDTESGTDQREGDPDEDRGHQDK